MYVEFEEGVDVGLRHHLGVEGPREAEDHDEEVERGELSGDKMGAEVGPVALSLTTWRGLEAHHRLFATDPVGQRELLEDGETAGVAETFHLFEESDGRELGELREPSQEVVLERIELRRE